MFLTNISIKRPVFTTMMNLLIVIFGIIAYKRMGVDNLPKVDLPIVNIRVSVPGATPRFIEQNVLNPIENAVRPIEGVDTIDSTASIGSVSVRVRFQLSEDINVAVNNVRNAMSGVTAKKSWPSTASTPAVKAVDPNASSILQVSVSSLLTTMDIGDLSQYLNDVFVPAIEQAEGVGDVGVAGLRLPEYDILFDNQKLSALSISALQVARQISLQIVTMPGGSVNDGKLFYNIDASTNPDSLSDLAQMPISLSSGQIVKLKDIANVLSTIQQQTSYGESDGSPSLIVYISKASSANTVEVAKNVRAVLKKLEEPVKDKINIRIVNDTSSFISEALNSVKFDISLGAFLTIMIVFLFLHDWKATLISSIAIPTSLIGSMAVMYLCGFTLNSMTTLALSLSIGIIVDDAIVVIENIHRHLEMGKTAFQATTDAMAEIGIPALAITFAIVAVFMPVAFMDGIIGRFFYEFGITVSVSVLISLFVAFTLTPCFGSRMLTVHKKQEKNIILTKINYYLKITEDFYEKAINYTLKNRLVTILSGFGILLISILLLHFVPTTFQPKQDTSYIAVGMSLNPNTDIPETISRARIVSQQLKKYPGVKNVFFRLTNSSEAMFMLNLVPPAQRDYTQSQLEQRLRKDLKKFRQNSDEVISVGKPGRAQQPLQIVLTHPDIKILNDYSTQLQNYLKNIEGIVDVTTDTPNAANQIKVTPNFVLANTLGVSTSDLATTLSYLFYGDTVGTFNKGGDTYDIVAKLTPSQKLVPADLLPISIPGRNNSIVSLSSVATTTIESSNSVIQHHNGMREYTVLADYTGTDLGKVLSKTEEFIKKTAPLGVQFNFAGDAKNLKDANSAVISALLLSFLFAYMVLCSQFESYLTPFVIILSVPLAFSGAFIFLLLFREPMSLYAMVGLILLTGLVKKNAILLLDFAEQKMRDGLDIYQALAIAGKTRLRPILMTTFAMIFGMLPMAFGNSLGHELRSPMGIGVIGGLISSTILTLLVIPCVFSVLDDFKKFLIHQLKELF
jgi:HAE1 family hydrophobic/amphiphilic exporter-1